MTQVATYAVENFDYLNIVHGCSRNKNPQTPNQKIKPNIPTNQTKTHGTLLKLNLRISTDHSYLTTCYG